MPTQVMVVIIKYVLAIDIDKNTSKVLSTKIGSTFCLRCLFYHVEVVFINSDFTFKHSYQE